MHSYDTILIIAPFPGHLGYGDFVPFEKSQYIFTSAYILVGVGVVGSLLGILISSFLDQVNIHRIVYLSTSMKDQFISRASLTVHFRTLSLSVLHSEYYLARCGL